MHVMLQKKIITRNAYKRSLMEPPHTHETIEKIKDRS